MDNEQLLALSKPYATPALQARHTDEATTSTLGGEPALPMGETWPRGQHPLSFLAQLDLATIQAQLPVEWLPNSGKLLFFYDVESEAWGFDPKDADCWQVKYIPQGTPTETLSTPDGAEAFEPAFLDFHPVGTFSEDGPFLPDEVALEEEAMEDFMQLVRTHDFGELPLHQIGGKHYAVQNEDMATECQLASGGVNCGSPDGYATDRAKQLFEGAKEWRLLFQLDSDDDAGWMWGDSGILYFWVREEDARKGDFSRVWCCLQCC